MKKGVKIFLITVFSGILISSGVVYYIFNKPHRDIKGEKPAFIMDAKALFEEFNFDEDAGNLKFGDKVIQVKGKIVEITINDFDVSIILNDEIEGINCALDSVAFVNNKQVIEKLKELLE